MRKVIDLCLDMPMGAEALTNMLSAMCLDPLYRGYKKTYGAGVAAQVGLTVEEIDAIYESEGRDGFLRIIREAAEKHAVKPAEFVRHLDEVGVEWGITCDGDHDNRKTAEIVQAFPKKFKGFIFVDPNRGEEAVRELEVCVKEYGLHALYLTAFRTKLNAADRKNYPLYSKACELGIPVHIYSSLNLSKAVPYDIGHPRYIDQVARDFPELKIMAGVSGWPWVLDFLCLAIRHENVYLNFETHAPEKIAMRGSGYEPYLYYGETSLKERICFASNWGTQSMPVEKLIAQVEALPFSDDAKEHILYNNATVGSWGMSSLRLPMWIGRNKVLDYMFLNEDFTGRQCYELGLASKVVADELVEVVGLATVKKMSKAAPIAVKYYKDCVRKATQNNIEEARAFELKAAEIVFATEDSKIGLKSVVENHGVPNCEFYGR